MTTSWSGTGRRRRCCDVRHSYPVAADATGLLAAYHQVYRHARAVNSVVPTTATTAAAAAAAVEKKPRK